MRRAVFLVCLFLILGCATKNETDPCKNKDYPRIMKDKALVDLEGGDYYSALNDIFEAKKCTPKDPEVYYIMGRIYLARRERDKARASFEQALKLNPKYPDANMAMGIMELEDENYEQAVKYFKVAAENDFYRQSYIAWNNIGFVYLQMGKLDEAEEALERCLVLNPRFCIAYCNLGELKSKQREYEQAVKNYKKALELCPQLARAHRLLGLEYNRQGKIELACREFGLALKYAQSHSQEADLANQYFQLLNCPPAMKE